MIHLHKNDLHVTINEKGAELQSIQYNYVEYLWQADEKFWGKHSPVLFPIVGELKDGKYLYKDKEYKLSRHGFARDKTFKKELLTESVARLVLQSDDETLQVYPFPFTFQVEYRLDEAALHCTYKVTNSGDDVLYFSVGGHPAFRVPLAKDGKYSDYYLEFDKEEALEKYALQNGLIANNTETLQLDNKRLHLTHELFYKDAIVLKHLDSTAIKLASDDHKRSLLFKFKDFPYFGIWAAKDADFVCLEPWCGIADNVDHSYDLTTKEGINVLQPGERWERSWGVEVK